MMLTSHPRCRRYGSCRKSSGTSKQKLAAAEKELRKVDKKEQEDQKMNQVKDKKLRSIFTSDRTSALRVKSLNGVKWGKVAERAQAHQNKISSSREGTSQV